VKSCRSCQRETFKDDEYFRNTIVLREDVYDHPAVKALLPTVWRSLSNSKARGLRQSFSKSVRMVNVVTPTGIYVESKPAMDVDLARLNRVASRILRGLFFKVTGSVLPDGYVAQAYQSSGFCPADPDVTAQFLAEIQNVIRRPQTISLGGNVFDCWRGHVEANPHISLWVMVFYKKVSFLGLTGLPEHMPRTGAV
jgi:hypothetical protein